MIFQWLIFMSWNVRQTLLFAVFDGGSKLKTSFSFIHQAFKSPSHFNQEKNYCKERTLTVFFSTNVVTEQASKMGRGCFYMSVSTVYLSLSLPNNKIIKKETSYVPFLPRHCSGYCSNLENKRIRREIISNFRPFSGVKCR